MANLLDAIGIVQVANVNPKTNVLDNAFTTFDYVYIQSQGDALASHPLTVQATDYAKACGAHTIFTTSKPTNKNSQKILRDPLMPETLAIADENNNIISVEPYTEDFCVQPVICLSTNKMQSLNLNLHTIEENGKHYIYFGAFPQSRVKDSKYAKYLDKMQKKGKLVGLNKTFQTHKVYAFEDYNKPNAKDTNQYIQVRVKHNGGKYFNDGEQMPYDFTNIWVKVEPIKWEITNWDNLPTFINPKGNGTENFVQLATEKGLISGIQYTSGSNYVNGVLP